MRKDGGALLVGDVAEHDVAEEAAHVKEGGARRRPPIFAANEIHLRGEQEEKKVSLRPGVNQSRDGGKIKAKSGP